jgi:hypothetical protein
VDKSLGQLEGLRQRISELSARAEII